MYHRDRVDQQETPDGSHRMRCNDYSRRASESAQFVTPAVVVDGFRSTTARTKNVLSLALTFVFGPARRCAVVERIAKRGICASVE